MTDIRFVSAPMLRSAPRDLDPALAYQIAESGPRQNQKRVPGQLCSVCGLKPVHARTFCHSCYKTHAPRKMCTTPGCGRKQHARSICIRCYESLRRQDKISDLREINRPSPERFAESVSEPNGAGCRFWTGHVSFDGYGRFTPETGQSIPAHHYAMFLAYGSYPEPVDGDRVCVDHRCRQRACVTVEHLEAVSYVESTRRARVWAGKSPATPRDDTWLPLAIEAASCKESA